MGLCTKSNQHFSFEGDEVTLSDLEPLIPCSLQELPGGSWSASIFCSSPDVFTLSSVGSLEAAVLPL